jgi:anaerobic magnesium-protoporphyrin IX monomethyl ester cyclase
LQQKPDVVLIGHPASTIAHASALSVMHGVKAASPRTVTVYGGLFPTFNSSKIQLDSQGIVDWIVPFEGEFAALNVCRQLAMEQRATNERETFVAEPLLVDHLDKISPAWENFPQLRHYRAFGFSSAVVQFSRGCPKTCSYCGQWSFWKKWRHRTIPSFIDEIKRLSDIGIRLFWIADENWSIDQSLFLQLLEALRQINRSHHLIVAMETDHVVRDITYHRLYREAGLSMIMLGLDSLDSSAIGKLPKNRRPTSQLRRACDSLQRQGIITIVNYLMPLDPRESLPRHDINRLCGLRANYYNVLFPTPHNWTAFGQKYETSPGLTDQKTWDYRHPCFQTSATSTARQLLRAKLLETWLHISSVAQGSWKLRNVLLHKATRLVLKVFLFEMCEAIASAIKCTATSSCSQIQKWAKKRYGHSSALFSTLIQLLGFPRPQPGVDTYERIPLPDGAKRGGEAGGLSAIGRRPGG